ncbi:TniQ family protein [Achromobacter aegrifaciens]|uniref:TniQ family protein n=1 Tax=Achromobacter aegrifaciens TaxID=1287736 RepID=UPI00358FCA39
MACGTLLVVPTPFVSESLTSWLLRVAEFHSASLQGLLSAFGLRALGDFDREFPVAGLWRLVSGIPTGRRTVSVLTAGWSVLRREDWQSAFVRTTLEGNHATAVCPKCLLDAEPYWQIPWRLKFYTACHEHRCPLRLWCPWCSSAISISREGLGAMKKHPIEKVLIRYCGVCCGDLTLEPASYPADYPLDELLQTQRAAVSALFHGRFRFSRIGVDVDLRNLAKLFLIGRNQQNLDQIGSNCGPMPLRFDSPERSLVGRFVREPYFEATEPLSNEELAWLVDYSINYRFSRFCGVSKSWVYPSSVSPQADYYYRA